MTKKLDEILKDDKYQFKAKTSRKCKCGHSIDFFESSKVSCTWCGRLVYKNKKVEFKERLGRKL